MSKENLTSAKWWARAACQARESMAVARTAGCPMSMTAAQNAYVCSKRHMWDALAKLGPRQRGAFDKYLSEQLRVFGLVAI
jgi:hypothetical protein